MKLFKSFLILQLVLLPFCGALHAEPAHAEESASYYQCSMHPWIVSDKPGNCPVCGMNLTQVHGRASGEVNQGRTSVVISPERQRMIGVTTVKAEVRPLVYSVHSVGHVAYNPDVAVALGEYREAYNAFRKVRGTPNEKLRERAMQLMELAELKLRLAGVGSQQFEVIKNASFDTRVLDDFFAPEGLKLPAGHAWIDADLYESDSELVKAGDEVSMSSPAIPGKIFSGVVRTSDALLNEFPRKLRIRIETEQGDVLKAGMAVDIRIMVKLGDKLSVPEDALIDTGHTQLVFVDLGGGSIEPREVQPGQLADGYYEIVAGIHEGERVVTSAAFLIDSESRLRAAAQNFSQKNSAEAAPVSGHRH